MADDEVNPATPRLRTPRAAAIAGILFAVLFSGSVVLVRLSVPADPVEGGAWLEKKAGTVSLAMSLLPFAGIAFLWFMGVVRDRIGRLEDQLLSTVFFGSGLLFLAMMFVSAALAGGALTSYALDHGKLFESGTYTLVRAVMFRVSNVYAVKMAAVFMISLATTWVRTRVMPRWLAILTYVLAVGLLLTTSSSLWLTLIFPAWVCAVSVYLLVSNLHAPSAVR